MAKAYVQLASGTVLQTDYPEYHNDAKRISKVKAMAILTKESHDTLSKAIKPGDRVYTLLVSRSRSGMSREIRAFIIRKGEPWDISTHVARLIGAREGKSGFIMGGCGMDMGFYAVYNLGRSLFRDSFNCIGEKCPSNDHSNGDKVRTKHKHSDAGYALRHSWL